MTRLVILVAVGLVLVNVPAAAGSGEPDRVSASGSAVIPDAPGFPTLSAYSVVSVDVRGGPTRQTATGTVSFTLVSKDLPGSLTLSGPVTCLNVIGGDHGVGTATSPTTAVITFTPTNISFEAVTMTLVDNGGGGRDRIRTAPARSPTECPSPMPGANGIFNAGRAIVVDARR